ncbi:unnamed protein product [Closterium sp. Naga37s-1]|nr:unnamed protein product [Closterium sp. Naga37s-1]
MSLFRPSCLSHSSQAALPQQAEGVLEAAVLLGRKVAALPQQAEGLLRTGSAAGQVGGAAPARPRPPSPHCSCTPHGRELDLLLGKWVEQHLPSLDPPHLTALARLMDEESPDLFKWFTGQEQAPEHVVQNPVYLSIRSKVDERLHRMHPAVRAAPGLPWVRGWEDMQRQPGTPPAGNQ